MSLWERVAQQPRAADVLAKASVEVLRRAADVSGRSDGDDEADEGTGHAWAFVGPAGVGQREAARALTAALNCPEGAAGEPCGSCRVCTASAAGALGDYHEFEADGPMYRVDDVRDRWLRAAFLSSVSGGWKVLRIQDAERMNEAAANAFLKGLEEPPKRTVWVLEIADPDELPETILSRCRVLRFSPWDTDALVARARAEGLDGADAALAARVASGSPLVVARLARPGGMDDLRAHREVFARLRGQGPGYALAAAHAIAQEVDRATAALVRAQAEELAELARGQGVDRAELPKRLQAAADALQARPRLEMKPKDVQALAGAFAEVLPKAAAKRVSDVYARRQREEKVKTAQAALDDMVGWLRDVLLVGAGGAPADALHRDAAAALRADAAALGARHALEAIDVLLATRESLERNVQQGLALEACFLQLSALLLASAAR